MKYRLNQAVDTLKKDISKLKNTENKLKESEEGYKNLLSMLPYGILVRDDSEVIYINEYGAKFIGFNSFREVIGKKMEELFYPHPDYKDEFDDALKLINDKGNMNLREEKFIRTKDNKVLDVETAITRIPYKDKKAILVVFRDISERKNLERLEKEIQDNYLKLQQALEYDKLRTEFFANISHEFKTPINVICAAIQTSYILIDEDNLNSNKIKDYLDIMKQNSLRLVRLVNNFLDITKINSGYLNIQLSNCDIVSTVENIVLSVVEYTKNKGINLVFDTEIEERIMACDRDKIERIILNLLSNSIKFTPAGGEIFVYIKEINNKIRMSVKDTGIGIPLEEQKTIFDRFVQIDKSLSREQEGSGIGLSLVKSLVEMHNGIIYVNSKCDKGSEFIIEIPITVIEDRKEKYNHSVETKVDKIDVEFSDIYI